MNEVFLIGKIISDIEFKFIINSKNKAITCFETEINNEIYESLRGVIIDK
jgi:single-stranded DNA-binding protein